ncbi:MAG TPA: glycosyltransferase family 39 protein [Pseudonocardiaceae bacterium]|nr:glycosyltransferase family 39 protein [Pseudonocardiaceae bacterium]
MTALAPDTRATDDDPPPPAQSRFARLLRGRPTDPRWVRPALFALLAATAVLYLVGLGTSGWANTFYSAAVQAGSTSWKAFFYGSSDAANSITVDKPPASLWVMDIFARLFGVNAWSILVPQALEGVASVGLLYATVRRWFSPGAALLSGLVLAITPVAVLMFRFNNPDALLVLLLVGAVYATVRALERASTGWLLLAGALLGFGFLTKMLQAFLILPALAIVYLILAPTGLGRRIWQLLLAGVSLVVAGGWWVAVVALVPAADRPYIGGSQTNSVLELAFGYNGFGRLTGNETGGLGNTNQDVGWGRLFASDMGGQISWLLPAALLLLVAGLWFSRRGPRTDRTRAALLLWGGWLVITGVVFSLSDGIIHPYYTVALAPAIAALVGIGAGLLWEQRATSYLATVVLAATVVLTSVWATVLLVRTSDWQPWLRIAIPVVGLATAALLLLGKQLPAFAMRSAMVLALLAGLAGPAAYAVDTAATAHNGAIPSAGPTSLTGFGGFGGGRGGAPGGGNAGGGFAGGGFPGGGGFGDGGTNNGGNNNTRGGGNFGGGNRSGNRGGGGGLGSGGGIGGLLDGTTPSAALVTLLDTNANDYTWVAAVVDSNSAAGYQLATDHSVMPIGGFNGTDPAPTLAQFEADVQAGKIHYFIASGGGGGGGGFGRTGATSTGSDDAAQITTWVSQHYTSATVGGVTVYDLTKSTA